MSGASKIQWCQQTRSWLLKGSANRNCREAGEDLELKMGENWRRLPVQCWLPVKLEDGQVVVQVVMNNDMEPDSIFRACVTMRIHCVSSHCHIRWKSKSLYRIRHLSPDATLCVFSGLQRHANYACQYTNRSPEKWHTLPPSTKPCQMA